MVVSDHDDSYSFHMLSMLTLTQNSIILFHSDIKLRFFNADLSKWLTLK